MLLPKLEDESSLLQRIAKDDEQAFKQLFFTYHQELGAFINSLLNDRESTLEVVQDIFLKIWVHRSRLPEIVNFTSYLFVIARNYTLNKIRQISQEQKKRRLYFDSVESVDSVVIEENNDQKEQRYDVLDNAIDKLPPQQQKVFILRQKGLKNPEIARILNISTASVAKYQQLALQSLSEYVKAYQLLLPLFFFLYL